MSCPLHFFFHGNPGMFYAARFKKRAALFRGVFSRAISGIIRASQTWGFGKVYRNSCFKLCGIFPVLIASIIFAPFSVGQHFPSRALCPVASPLWLLHPPHHPLEAVFRPHGQQVSGVNDCQVFPSVVFPSGQPLFRAATVAPLKHGLNLAPHGQGTRKDGHSGFQEHGALRQAVNNAICSSGKSTT